MLYNKGKHIIASINSTNTASICKYDNCKIFINELVAKFSLVKLGEVYHNFNPEGFTAVICLSESHLSLHTWPEHGLINLDIYLSNFQRNNNDTVEELFNLLVQFFNASVIHKQTILR